MQKASVMTSSSSLRTRATSPNNQPELWAQVLVHDHVHRRALLTKSVYSLYVGLHGSDIYGLYIVATTFPECTDPDNVSVLAKAFLLADLPIEFIRLLDIISLSRLRSVTTVVYRTCYSLAAIRANKVKVVGYINGASVPRRRRDRRDRHRSSMSDDIQEV